MFILERREASAGLRDQAEANSIVRGLQSVGFKPLLNETLDSAYRAAGLTRPTSEMDLLASGRTEYLRANVPAVAELFFSPTQLLILEPLPGKLRVWSVRPHSSESQLDEFCDAVRKVATSRLDGRRLRGMTFAWRVVEPNHTDRNPFEPPPAIERLKSIEAVYSQDEARLAGLLASHEERAFLGQLARSRGRARSVDTAASANSEIITKMRNAGLVADEYLIVCRQDSRAVCTIRDRSQLEASLGAGLRCSVCGRTFREEDVQEIHVLTDTAKKLLDNSFWMLVWVTELLRESGMSSSSIAWNATAGEDEVDIIADMHGTKVFFELKDRDFGLGDAYRFAFRVQRYGGEQGVVVSTGIVAAEVKAFFKERAAGASSQAEIHLVEGAKTIAKELPRVVEALSRVPIVTLGRIFSDTLGLNLEPLLVAWMKHAATPKKATGPVVQSS